VLNYQVEENPFWGVNVHSEMLRLELCGCGRREVEWKVLTMVLDSIRNGFLAGPGRAVRRPLEVPIGRLLSLHHPLDSYCLLFTLSIPYIGVTLLYAGWSPSGIHWMYTWACPMQFRVICALAKLIVEAAIQRHNLIVSLS